MHFSHNPMHYLHIASHCNLYHVDDPLKKSFDATPNTSGILLFCLGISEARVKNLQRNIRHIFLSSDVVGAFKFQFRMRGSSQRSGQLGFFSKRLKSPFVSFMWGKHHHLFFSIGHSPTLSMMLRFIVVHTIEVVKQRQEIGCLPVYFLGYCLFWWETLQ